LAQFCGGMDEFVAKTEWERFFQVAIFLLAFVAAASGLELNKDNYDSTVAGKQVFIKFLAPW